MEINKEIKQLIDNNKNQIYFGGGRNNKKTLLSLQLNLLVYLRLRGLSWDQIEHVVWNKIECVIGDNCG